MSESEDDSSKTEEPSQKKLEEARKKGQIASSRELNHFFMLLAMIGFVIFLGPKLGHDVLNLLAPLIIQPDQYEMDAASVSKTLRTIVIGFIVVLLLTFLLSFAAALAPVFIQRKWVFSVDQITPKLSKISPLAGFGRLFGMKAVIEFIKNFLKISVVCIICVMIALPYQDRLPDLLRSPDKMSLVTFSAIVAKKMLIGICIFLFLLAILDYLYQRFVLMKSLRMSKQELKDEYRQQEGDPHVKGKLKQIRREKAKKRMMANVPKADVIITNPTHYAVALQYDAASMQAPVVLAKGVDAVAARIRELAQENKVPIVRNPPLARILYDTTDIEDEIPLEHYQAVAKIIGYVYRLKGKTPGAPKDTKGGKGGGSLPILKLKK